MDKSSFHPMSCLEWLGFRWNLVDSILEVPEGKIERLIYSASSILAKHNVTARQVASVLWKIISLKPALGSICQLFTRNLTFCILTMRHWDSVIHLSDGARHELDFWVINCSSLPRRVITPIFRDVDRLVFTDASTYAGAGVLFEQSRLVAHFTWDHFDSYIILFRSDGRVFISIEKKEKIESNLDEDLLTRSHWGTFAHFKDHETFGGIVQMLPQIVKKSKADTTNKKYDDYFKRFRVWCNSHQFSALPCSVSILCLFLGGLIQRGVSVSVLESFYYSISWYHKFTLGKIHVTMNLSN
ncbi:hypothetical protein KUTeg_018572 [Tegillarca granosa]|uniref:Uncharacterized protein n=1 Tax=Tegillarca granosa TaxID=220873 RepID=A0ABQ9EI90_TEGGR|nr:hypothetical protein KUTeg_018572 [Tegillarca granosa]